MNRTRVSLGMPVRVPKVMVVDEEENKEEVVEEKVSFSFRFVLSFVSPSSQD